MPKRPKSSNGNGKHLMTIKMKRTELDSLDYVVKSTEKITGLSSNRSEIIRMLIRNEELRLRGDR